MPCLRGRTAGEITCCSPLPFLGRRIPKYHSMGQDERGDSNEYLPLNSRPPSSQFVSNNTHVSPRTPHGSNEGIIKTVSNHQQQAQSSEPFIIIKISCNYRGSSQLSRQRAKTFSFDKFPKTPPIRGILLPSFLVVRYENRKNRRVYHHHSHRCLIRYLHENRHQQGKHDNPNRDGEQVISASTLV